MRLFITIQKHVGRYFPTVICLTVVLCIASCNISRKQEPPATMADPKLRRALVEFNQIEGTQYLLAAIGSEDQAGFYSGSYKSTYTGGVYNYVFFDTISESADRLLPTNDHLVLSAIRF